MDQRRIPTFLQSQSKVKEGNNFLKSLWIYALYGVCFNSVYIARFTSGFSNEYRFRNDDVYFNDLYDF